MRTVDVSAPAETPVERLRRSYVEACGVGAGDEVIVPGLSWVASASAVLGINAVPVLVDVDPQTFCVTAETIEAAITPRTKAITIVHFHSAVAELRTLSDLAHRYGIPLVEDCAQAHGARYAERRVGSIGSVGAFSMHGVKLLTSGEGGAVVTDSPEIASRAQHLRADGRSLSMAPVANGAMELVETGAMMGSNACMSEFHAAIALAQLERLDAQNAKRCEAGAYLNERLSGLDCEPQCTSPQTTARTYYRYAVQLPQDILTMTSVATVAAALSAELGVSFLPTRRPLSDNPLNQPATRPRYALSGDFLRRVDPSKFDLPSAMEIHRRTVTFGHELLLAPPDSIELIALAFDKVLSNIAELRG